MRTYAVPMQEMADKAGAFDFVAKPVDIGQLRKLVETALRLAAGKPPGDAAAKLIGDKHDAKADKALVDDAIAAVAKG